jgi:PTS system galactitol-specific IIB component
MAAGKKKRILLSCGSGIVTSTIARKKVEELLDSHGYKGQYEITQVPLAAAPGQSHNYDFIVATSIAPTELHCPYVNGVPYLMGIGTEASDAEILRLMEE